VALGTRHCGAGGRAGSRRASHQRGGPFPAQKAGTPPRIERFVAARVAGRPGNCASRRQGSAAAAPGRSPGDDAGARRDHRGAYPRHSLLKHFNMRAGLITLAAATALVLALLGGGIWYARRPAPLSPPTTR